MDEDVAQFRALPFKRQQGTKPRSCDVHSVTGPTGTQTADQQRAEYMGHIHACCCRVGREHWVSAGLEDLVYRWGTRADPMKLIPAIPWKQQGRNTKRLKEAVEIAVTGEEAWLPLKDPGRRRLQRKMDGAVCNCSRVQRWEMALQCFSRKSGEQVLAKGSERGKQNKSHGTSTPNLPPFGADLLFEQ